MMTGRDRDAACLLARLGDVVERLVILLLE
jgi:hypothetical protein